MSHRAVWVACVSVCVLVQAEHRVTLSCVYVCMYAGMDFALSHWGVCVFLYVLV